MELVVSGWGRDHGEKVIARRDLTEARSSTFGSFERPEVYITTTEGKEVWPYGVRAIPRANVEVRFFAKVALNGEYLARLTLTRKEVAKLFLSQYHDCSIEEWLEVLAEVKEAYVSRRQDTPVLTKSLDQIGVSAEAFRLLRKYNIWQVGDLVQKTEDQLLALPNFEELLWDVKDVLTPLGLQLGMKIKDWTGGVPKVLYRKLDEFELSVRTSGCLRMDNIIYVGDLAQKTEAEMLRIPNFGRKSLNEVKEAVLDSLGLQLGTFPQWHPPSD